tara:strand:- start:714 stop:872 length:159 start_codon:yes stop_codon:yes gene_type:complete
MKKTLHEKTIAQFCKKLKEESRRLREASESLPVNPSADFLDLWNESINKPID